ncbi:hypothetical protein OJAV_G00165570 [Oryzias javanicus]|uniref:Pyrin domain-containing protein n=1 Tax=Oryzias javanicus TaxID=123683 RepID=A0A3S2P3A5_ORYJA|nr:hypothetical protein OJAV_G00165570 [Oryzias javanicus]
MSLKKLSKNELKEFVSELVDREGDQKVYKKQVEDKDYIDIADVMVSVFSEYALHVAVEVLREVNMNNYADELAAAEQEHYESNSVETNTDERTDEYDESEDEYEESEDEDEEHLDEYDEHQNEYDERQNEYAAPLVSAKEFVEKNKKKLIAKVVEANALLDVLHNNKVLDDHSYCKIKALSSDKKKMKKLLTGAYLASETACYIFCDFLYASQAYLISKLLNY